jgi:phosphate uptake regulator
MERELGLLGQGIVHMGGLVEQAVGAASAALTQRRADLARTVIEADDEIDLAENDYLCQLASALELPASALAGLTVDVEIEDIKDTFARMGASPG